MEAFEIAGGVRAGGGAPLFLISGPCVIESREHCLEVAARIRDIAGEAGVPLIFKSSYDKANRSSVRSYRGPGIDAGLEILAAVRETVGVPVLTDVHSPEEARRASTVVDVIQVPAFLCRQTDLVLAAAEGGKTVNVKKGQFVAPWDMRNVVDKVRAAGNRRLLLTERGASFGYNNLVVDMKSLGVLRGLGTPVVFDATHSAQLPGGLGHASGGQRDFVPLLARAAVAAGVDGVFFEVHEDPDRALSDGPNSMPLDAMPGLLRTLLEIDAAAGVRGAP
ncbi:MAG: 3-deoxy-8-phosphooctulonate synthase [Acidobacteriota bacterium]|jgi:2-dehydro-3-deoxyphosphooctonate aldolase (KDO 8-P synthase)